ncbi:MAG: hypothetical protein ABR529_01430 [Actinomycetota bacterium]
MTDFFLVFLGGAWLVVFWPSVIKAKRSTPLFTAESWRRRMQLMAPRGGAPSGRWVVAPRSSGAVDRTVRRSRERSQRRRIRLLVALALSIPTTLVAALVRGGGLWEVHLSTYALLAVYVAVLVEVRRGRDESARKVRALAERRDAAPADGVGMFAQRRA